MAYRKSITMVLLIALITELFPMGWIGKRLLMLATAVVIFLVFSVYISSKIKKERNKEIK